MYSLVFYRVDLLRSEECNIIAETQTINAPRPGTMANPVRMEKMFKRAISLIYMYVFIKRDSHVLGIKNVHQFPQIFHHMLRSSCNPAGNTNLMIGQSLRRFCKYVTFSSHTKFIYPRVGRLSM